MYRKTFNTGPVLLDKTTVDIGELFRQCRLYNICVLFYTAVSQFCVTKPTFFLRKQNVKKNRLSLVSTFFMTISERQYNTFSWKTIAVVGQWHSIGNNPQK